VVWPRLSRSPLASTGSSHAHAWLHEGVLPEKIVYASPRTEEFENSHRSISILKKEMPFANVGARLDKCTDLI
jgi:hypothetical protein